MRPMQFPRRFPWLIALVLLPFSGVLFLPLGLWYWVAYPPVQHYYLGAYFESAFVGDHSTVALPVQWLYKTAPGNERELAMVADVASDSADNDLHLPMKLSPRARDEGWTGLGSGTPRSNHCSETQALSARDLLRWGKCMAFVAAACAVGCGGGAVLACWVDYAAETASP